MQAPGRVNFSLLGRLTRLITIAGLVAYCLVAPLSNERFNLKYVNSIAYYCGIILPKILRGDGVGACGVGHNVGKAD